MREVFEVFIVVGFLTACISWLRMMIELRDDGVSWTGVDLMGTSGRGVRIWDEHSRRGLPVPSRTIFAGGLCASLIGLVLTMIVGLGE